MKIRGSFLRKRKSLPAPVVVGGVGGSGTRVVASLLAELGYFMGSDLNSSNDNLWFTLLFKRPKWFGAVTGGKNDLVLKGLEIFTAAMTGSLTPLPGELDFIMSAAAEMADSGHDHLGAGRGGWAVKRAWNMLRSEGNIDSTYIGWGWKEPNTHIYLNYLNEYFASLRYIYVIRHGLDMAFSDNQAQLFSWGPLFGVRISDLPAMLPAASLEYWIRANKKAIDYGRDMGREKFFLLNFEKLCASPESEIPKLTGFLGLSVTESTIERLSQLPQMPKSVGRYRGHDLKIFSRESLDSVRELGFEIEAA